MLAAIGPFWDGNEVWLARGRRRALRRLPAVLAVGASGFYLAIFLVLWLLILRGLSIEFRGHVENPLWRASWDVVFRASPAVLPVLFGVALGNLVRGVPLGADGWFSLRAVHRLHAAAARRASSTGTRCCRALRARRARGARRRVPRVEDRRPGARAQPPRRELSYAAVAVLWPLLTAATSLVNAAMLAALPHGRWRGCRSARRRRARRVALGLRRSRDLRPSSGRAPS